MKTKYSLTRNFLFSALTIALTFFLLPQLTHAQSTYSLSPKAKVYLKVNGSSNVHDWEMISSTMQSKGVFKFNAQQVLTSIKSLQLTVSSKTLKSEHASLDNRAYKVLKANQHPKIVYNLRSTDITPLSKNRYLVKALGDLTIAGSRQIILMDVNVVVNPDNSITCTGTEKINFSDYGIQAPKYMAGTMKVGNALTIGFAQTYQK